MSLVERINQLCKENGTSLTGLERQLGFGNGTIRRWDKIAPSIEKVASVASYFGVSIDYLTGKTNERRPAESVAAITDDDLPPEALKELENYKEFLRMKYSKKN